jgi:hypothetical protein
MDATSSRWTQVTPSAFAWERASLDHGRAALPDADPWRAWSNFEIVDNQGVAEVDLMVLSSWGLWVIEIKSRPGTITGDAHTWTWRRPNGRDFADDNPLIGCDRKAKRIKSLLQRTGNRAGDDDGALRRPGRAVGGLRLLGAALLGPGWEPARIAADVGSVPALDDEAPGAGDEAFRCQRTRDTDAPQQVREGV